MCRRFTMLVVKVDRNEYTENGSKREIWGYQFLLDGHLLKQEVIKARVNSDDTRLMRYIRCYQWAFEKISGYINTNSIGRDTLNIYFTNSTINTWLHNGKVYKDYRIAFDKVMGVLDNIPMTLKFIKVDRNWSFRKLLVNDNITRERYSNLASFLNSMEGD